MAPRKPKPAVPGPIQPTPGALMVESLPSSIAPTAVKDKATWIKDLLFPLIAAVVSGAGCVGLTLYFTPYPHLSYSPGQIVPFQNNFGIFNITITNDGYKPLTNVKCRLLLEEAKIHVVSCGKSHAEPKIITDEAWEGIPKAWSPGDEKKIDLFDIPRATGNKADVSFAAMPPGETITISVLANNPNKIEVSRKLVVSSDDVLGVMKSDREALSIIPGILFVLGFSFLAAIADLVAIQPLKRLFKRK